MSKEIEEQINIVKNWQRFLNENIDKPITLYHKVGGRQQYKMEDRVKSVVKNGLIPHDSVGGEYSERGNIIWFSSDYSQYGENGEFVVSFEYNEENRKKYDMRFDGQYCSVFKQIPFSELTVIKIPIILMGDNRVLSSDFLIKALSKKTPSDELSSWINEYKYKIFIDLFEKYVQPHINNPKHTSNLKEMVEPTLLINV